MRLRLPAERPTEPPTGYKIAHPVLSQDGTRVGFTGVSLGGALPYGVLDGAACVYGRRHRPPARLCDCGFHCVHERPAAEALLCVAENRAAMLLEVSVLGAYIRFERGFRYARQRVRTATVGPCACGARPVALADAGWGRPGWRALAPACAGCVRARTSVSLAGFARLAGDGLRVSAEGTGAPPGGRAADGRGGPAGARVPEGFGVPELVAEAALLQARLDWFQTQLARLGDRGTEEGAGS
ncbi:hypothetical protein ACFC09_44440 [Streptomyces sp. NPDC056161]|uniref:hypothetical protein n=1 Tax=Streptomyces sp. NPDC056161 TaxID=3345732 RepID=UPI0035DF8A5A